MTDASQRNSKPRDRDAQSPRSLFKLTPLAAAVIAALGPTEPVIAQEEDDSLVIDEILVTATKREISLQDVPHSISVLSSAQLQRMGAKDLEATIRALPSVNLTALQPGQNSLVVRGISSGPFEYRTEAQVAVYLDEQPLTFNSQQVGIRNIDMERIENLPGPQGTLFGSSSQTGTIRYITNKPRTDTFLGQVEGRYGTTSGGEGSYDVNGFLNIPLIEDKLAIRAVGFTSHDGGYVDNVFGTSLSGNYDNADKVEEDFNEYDVDGGRLHVQWNMSDKWSTLFTVIGENTTATGVWDTDAALPDYQVTRFEDEIRTDDWYSASATIEGDLGFADLSFTATKFERDIVYEYDNMTYTQWKDRYYGGGLYYELYYAGDPNYVNYYNYGLYNTDYYRSIVFNDQTQERETFELRLVSKGDSRFQWMVGGYYEDVLDQWFYGARIPGLTNTTAWAAAQAYAYFYSVPNYYNSYTIYNYNQAYPIPDTDIGYTNELNRTVQQTAIFGELSVDISDTWTIHGGARWAEFDRDILNRFSFPQGLIPFQDLASGGDGSYRDVGQDDDTIFKIGVKYNVDDDRMLYALYSQGFRVGGVNSQRAARTGAVSATYTADYLDNYEIGIKSQWLDGRLTLNGSVFRMLWDDYQQSFNPGAWWLRGIANAADAETTGIEVQLQWQITDRLAFSTNLFTANPEFTENFCNDFVDSVNLGCVLNSEGQPVYASDPDDPADIFAGMPMPNSPETTISASVYYTIPNVLGGDLWLYYDFYYKDEVWSEVSNIAENDRNGLAPSWTYSTFSAGLQLPKQFDIELNVRNLFDQQGYSYVWTGEAENAELFGDPRFRQIRAQDRPRTVWLTLRKGFGGT